MSACLWQKTEIVKTSWLEAKLEMGLGFLFLRQLENGLSWEIPAKLEKLNISETVRDRELLQKTVI